MEHRKTENPLSERNRDFQPVITGPIRPENHRAAAYKEIVLEYLTPEEVRSLMEKSDLKGLLQLLSVWGWIAAAFAVAAIWTNPVTIALALVIIGAKQLGCAIIMHDASHYSMFRTRKLNDLLGNWFGAYPLIHNVGQYRPYHLRHHLATGTADDPDVHLTTGYPTSGAGIVRKFSRDLAGVSGLKGYFGILAMHLGYIRYNLGNYIERVVRKERGYIWKNAWNNLRGPLAFHAMLLGVCWAAGHPWLYLLWPVSLLTTHMLVLRIRSMAEHSMVDDPDDPLRNTRTLKANWLERLLFAPLNVNYHLEHHLLFTVPSYNFPAMHALLRERGLYEKASYSDGYWNIVKMAMRPGPAQ